MKYIKQILLGLMAYYVIPVTAQPIITSSWARNAGETYTTQWVKQDTVYPGINGANVVWDFSGVIDSSGTTVLQYLDPATTPYAAHFPTANVAIQTLPGTYDYFMNNNDSVTHLGTGNDTTTIKLTHRWWNFDMEYNKPYARWFHSDSFHSKNDVYYRFGYNMIEPLGWGTLKLPNSKTYTNVMKVVVTYSILDSMDNSGIQHGYGSYQYLWIHPDTKAILFQWTLLYRDYQYYSMPAEYAINPVFTGVSQQISHDPMLIYPNPSNDYIQLPTDQKGKISITDMSGRTLLEWDPAALGTRLPVSGLSQGTYMLSMETSTGTVTQQIQVLH